MPRARARLSFRTAAVARKEELGTRAENDFYGAERVREERSLVHRSARAYKIALQRNMSF